MLVVPFVSVAPTISLVLGTVVVVVLVAPQGRLVAVRRWRIFRRTLVRHKRPLPIFVRAFCNLLSKVMRNLLDSLLVTH